MRCILFVFLLLGNCFTVFLCAQKRSADSLKALIRTDKEDTSKIKHLNALAVKLVPRNPDTALTLSTQALKLSEKINAVKGIAQSCNQLGSFYANFGESERSMQYYMRALETWDKLLRSEKDTTAILTRKTSTLCNIGANHNDQGNYFAALDYFFQAKKIAEVTGNKNKLSGILLNIGNTYLGQGDYLKSLDGFFGALKIAEEQNAPVVASTALGNIGIVYCEQKEYSKALPYYLRALKIDEELGNKNGIARHLGSIGTIYYEQKDYTRTLEYYLKAQKIFEEIGAKNELTLACGNVGLVYQMQKNYPEAQKNFLTALKMSEETGDKNTTALQLGNLGSLYTVTKDYGKAEKCLLQGLAICDSIGSLNTKMQIEGCMSELFSQMGKNKEALVHFRAAMKLKDSLFSEDKNKEITRKAMTYEFAKKEAATKAEQEKREAVNVSESKKQKIIIYSIAVGLALVLIITLVIFRSLYVTRRQKSQIEKQKKLVEEQKIKVDRAYEQLHEKNKEVLDSIYYARRIQRALLTSEKYIGRVLKTQK